MQKIGLAKCSNKNIKYFNMVSRDEIIYDDELNLNTISSTIVNSFILHTEFIENLNAIRIFLKIIIKIIYSKAIDNSLYVYEKEIFTTEYIYVPKTIDGSLASQLFIKNKIKPEVFIENINIKNIHKDKIILNFYILLNLKISPSFYFCYIINNGLFDNIFISYSDGKNLTQKTFTSELEYTNIRYQPNGQNLVFVGSSNDKSNIYISDYNSSNKSDVDYVNICGIVNSFDFMNNNKLILSIKENDGDFLYILELKGHIIKKLNYTNISKHYTNPYFDSNLNILYFLCVINNTTCLCSFDRDNNFDNLFDFAEVSDYVVSNDGEKIILKIFKDNEYKLYVLHTTTKFLEPINLDFEYDDILKISFFDKIKFDGTILILYSNNNFKYVASYDFKFLKSNIIFSSEIIHDFTVDINTLDIFISTKTKNFNELIKINNNTKEVLLKMPSTIKCICIK